MPAWTLINPGIVIRYQTVLQGHLSARRRRDCAIVNVPPVQKAPTLLNRMQLCARCSSPVVRALALKQRGPIPLTWYARSVLREASLTKMTHSSRAWTVPRVSIKTWRELSSAKTSLNPVLLANSSHSLLTEPRTESAQAVRRRLTILMGREYVKLSLSVLPAKRRAKQQHLVLLACVQPVS